MSGRFYAEVMLIATLNEALAPFEEDEYLDNEDIVTSCMGALELYRDDAGLMPSALTEANELMIELHKGKVSEGEYDGAVEFATDVRDAYNKIMREY